MYMKRAKHYCAPMLQLTNPTRLRTSGITHSILSHALVIPLGVLTMLVVVFYPPFYTYRALPFTVLPVFPFVPLTTTS